MDESTWRTDSGNNSEPRAAITDDVDFKNLDRGSGPMLLFKDVSAEGRQITLAPLGGPARAKTFT